MSYDAEKWAREQTVGNARAKFVLIELANCLNGSSGLCCPSIDRLSQITEMKRHTVITAINHLVDLGLVKKTVVKTKTGRSNQYELIGSFNDDFDASDSAETVTTHSAENGITGDAENGTTLGEDSVENGTTHSAKFGMTHSAENGTVTRNKNKEILIKEKDKKEKLSCPDGISDQVFKEWVRYKKSKSKICTQRMVDAIVRESEKAGIGAEDAMIYQMEQGWQGFNAEWYRNKMGNNSRTKRGVAKPEKDYTNVDVPNGGGSISEFFNF